MRTIDRVSDVGELAKHLPGAIRRELVIAPAAYHRFTYGWKGGDSDNWDELAAACELLNLLQGNPTDTDQATLVEFLRRKLADRRFMQKEFGSWIYLDLHVLPTLIQLACARRLALSATEPWAEIADGLQSWLRALCGWLVWTGCWGAGRTWARDVAHDGPGARCLEGRGDYNPRLGGSLYCTLTGKRSWHFEDAWRENLFAPIFLSWVVLGERRTGGDILPPPILVALGESAGISDVLTKNERELAAAAIRNDLSALEWAAKLIGDWLPAEPVVVVRAVHGVGCYLLEAGHAPTATTYACTWRDDATTWAAGACNGFRGGHAEHIEPGRAEIDLVTRRGFCERTAGPDRKRVEFPLPEGDLVAVLRAHHGEKLAITYYVNGVERPAPQPTPSPTPAPPAPQPGKPSNKKKGKKLLPLLAAAALLAGVLILRGC